MKKIERKWPIGTADNEVVIKETDLDELEQQRDELIERLVNICIDANKHGIRYITAQKTLSKITGKSWEEIKGGEK